MRTPPTTPAITERTKRQPHPLVAAIWAGTVAVALLLIACSGKHEGSTSAGPTENAPPASPFAGSYSGVVRASSVGGQPTPGVVHLVVDETGAARADVFDQNTNGTFTLLGTVAASGHVSLTRGGSNARLDGTIANGAIKSGFWSNGDSQSAGPWYAEADNALTPHLFWIAKRPQVLPLPSELSLAGLGIALGPQSPAFSSVMLSRVATESILQGLFARPTAWQSAVFLLFNDSGMDTFAVFEDGRNGSQLQVRVFNPRSLKRPGGPAYIIPYLAGGTGVRAIELFPGQGLTALDPRYCQALAQSC